MYKAVLLRSFQHLPSSHFSDIFCCSVFIMDDADFHNLMRPKLWPKMFTEDGNYLSFIACLTSSTFIFCSTYLHVSHNNCSNNFIFLVKYWIQLGGELLHAHIVKWKQNSERLKPSSANLRNQQTKFAKKTVGELRL